MCSTPFGIKGFYGAPPEIPQERRKECSTPFGIKGFYGPQHPSIPSRALDVLNAFRHQRFLRPGQNLVPFSNMCVLNAFRHQRFLRFVNCSFAKLRTKCSTPFGIKGFYGGQPSTKPTKLLLCSTPFGIKGFYGPRALRILSASESAQRLSASKVSTVGPRGSSGRRRKVLNAFRHQRFLRSLLRFVGFVVSIMCSTPFGIKGFYGGMTPLARNPPNMCSTPFGIKGFYGNQRPRMPRTIWCAQRLSASKVSTAYRALEILVFGKRVLNAFRHQRFLRTIHLHREERSMTCSTPFGIKGFYGVFRPRQHQAVEGVLNAFRHQRFLRRAGCSAILPSGYVLNAFRHQRFLRFVNCSFAKLRTKCSTPFGIKGFYGACFRRGPFGHLSVLNAFRHQRFLRRSPRGGCRGYADCAQRLSASKVSTAGAPARPRPRRKVLNAFRHQRFLRVVAKAAAPNLVGVLNAFRHQRFLRAPSTSMGTIMLGAQRLSASKVSTAVLRYPSPSNFVQCSTPFGIKGFYGVPSRRHPIQVIECSTPFGIKGFYGRSIPGPCSRIGRAQRLSASKVSTAPSLLL